ncbi:hypothetical protein F4820DRAFT_287210 [Hypoxylon rubiginosum]|uniref:Uncharacterized protein n=1 Tax=Hypoxylon rubiginosum TaxID=110542 RepID=A0ACB9ZG89_9PEZI|nr:hypothetical protein F4820DRAFT_287210 [Hypoxylon rubiginosum]
MSNDLAAWTSHLIAEECTPPSKRLLSAKCYLTTLLIGNPHMLICYMHVAIGVQSSRDFFYFTLHLNATAVARFPWYVCSCTLCITHNLIPFPINIGRDKGNNLLQTYYRRTPHSVFPQTYRLSGTNSFIRSFEHHTFVLFD